MTEIYGRYLEELQQQDSNADLTLYQYYVVTEKSHEYLDEATDIFREVVDIPNLALLFCNKGRYLRFRAHCDQAGDRWV